ncbi:YdcF family protein [Alicyclobacillus tolerans]|uniref:Protein SanA, affects membrane permeability for vancomycin n=2 Tax=Alicyclobacillus tolerans TaxID=90970 RepID=A0A1M6JVC2_9BACL|nr:MULTISPECIES: YdcF family protein [Alicyclobacillus]MDP9727393.1 vancomycin permeability regulator SanA [Alicyclobacillus tengchongensis]QRF23127.1 YdcF family protein [Alicyclobacillus sp. TC]SHJ50631.1 protein SanA, affects membrane permeability for vancomycin [Alicyclobacillus montanus]
MWKTILFLLLLFLCAPLLIYRLLAIMAEQLSAQGRNIRPVPADVAIVLGAFTDGYRPSPPLIRRLHAAIDLYRMGYMQAIIVSGGRGQDEKVTESHSMKRFLVMNGVAPHVIFEEHKSSDTWENLRNSLLLMNSLGFADAIIVTSDYHLPRALAVAKKLSIPASGYAAKSGKQERRYAVREIFARIQYTLLRKSSWT